MRIRRMSALAVAAAIVVGACSSPGPRTGPSAAPSADTPTVVGAGEGALNLVAWAGYVVGGTGGEQVAEIGRAHV